MQVWLAVAFVNVIELFGPCVYPVQPCQPWNGEFGPGTGVNVTVLAPLSSVQSVPLQNPPVMLLADTELWVDGVLLDAIASALILIVLTKFAVQVRELVGFKIVIDALAATCGQPAPLQPVKR